LPQTPILSKNENIDRVGIQPFHRLYFKAAVTCFQIKRSIENKNNSRKLLSSGEGSDFPFLLAESRSSIFSDRLQERPFENGKLENLRIATRALDKLVVDKGAEFSFWNQIGKPTASRGFQVGREIRWGCMIPGVGGGLCQLSGALFDCALQIEAQITEVHSHTRRLPNVTYRPEMDATVFWNYVDLRFRPKFDVLIEPVFTEDSFVLRFWGKSAQALTSTKAEGAEKALANDCLDCGIEDCHYHGRTQVFLNYKNTIFNPSLEPLSTVQRLKSRFLSIASKILNRVLSSIPLPVGKIAILRNQALAFLVKTVYSFQRSTAIISQDLAPFLKNWLQKRNIPYVLKLEHLPMKELQSRLDILAMLHPEDSRLRDYRVSEPILEQEMDSIKNAKSLLTDHPYLKELFPAAELKMDLPRPPTAGFRKSPAKMILFPGPCYAREGTQEVLQAAERLNLEVLCPHSSAKGKPPLKYVEKAEIPWEKVLAYVHPCVFDRPNEVLRQAVNHGIRIVGTLGIPYRGVLLSQCALGDAMDLEDKLRQIMDLKGGSYA
jgi:hypothetical protein